ncbi:heparinase II/III domain-containing protein [Persicobacter psychrovividus]|uniref:Heparinase II/III-like C-terminal domain-containing protein n=1 Tax=Persicobacter psychrovividus TaxID=387638 RepID=A0ABN6LDH6_9BACT|nr:hypothetical protein PEPS_35350 [Persicobacter psychrovividus]
MKLKYFLFVLIFGLTIGSVRAQQLFFTKDRIDKIEKLVGQDELYQQFHQHLIHTADQLCNLPVPEKKMTGRRLLNTCSTFEKYIFHLSYAYQFTHQQKYADKIVELLDEALSYESWNPKHYLDVAEMALGVSIGINTLEEHPKHKTWVDQLYRLAIVPSMEERPYVKGTNNWNAVCHAGITSSALVCQEQYPKEASFLIHRAEKEIKNGLQSYDISGNFPEGPSYWIYGTSFNLILYDLLKVNHLDYSTFEQYAGFWKSGDYYRWSIGSDNTYYNYFDCKGTTRLSPAMAMLSQINGRPDFLTAERAMMKSFMENYGEQQVKSSKDRLAPLFLLWLVGNGSSAEVGNDQTYFVGGGENPVVFWHHQQDGKAVFLGIKGGKGNLSHGHLDAGSFIYEKDGIRWFEDLGRENYTHIESFGKYVWTYDSKAPRWEFFRHHNLGHNTISVDQKAFNPDGFVALDVNQISNETVEVSADLSPLYTQEQAIKRNWFCDGEKLKMTDQFSSSLGKELNWRFFTKAKVVVAKNGKKATLQRNGKSLTIKLKGVKDARFNTLVMNPHFTEMDSPNKEISMLSIDLNAKEAGTLTFIIE